MPTIPSNADLHDEPGAQFVQSSGFVLLNCPGHLPDVIRQTYELGLELLLRHNCRQLLDDCSQLASISVDHQQWLMQTWLPALAQAKPERYAILLPIESLSSIQISALFREAFRTAALFSGLQVRYFESDRDARNWLSAA